ncbi:hypothetical protein [Collimonas sp.]|jgi:hypothetical protein|uniref:hypothetical protein n=1 Tax=Collimonas sp. TaxID=1963772 RepID=UPI002C7059DB|nr:hypothetical protein [Collimonas sp.]HWW07944.1 hypothetical protein [Collimonas sp.]
MALLASTMSHGKTLPDIENTSSPGKQAELPSLRRTPTILSCSIRTSTEYPVHKHHTNASSTRGAHLESIWHSCKAKKF